jgi:hypothetical protein
MVPPDVSPVRADPPLMRGEDVGLYNKLTHEFTISD